MSTYIPNSGCIIAEDANFPKGLPLFGQLENVLLANEEIIFEYTPLETLEFSSILMGRLIK